jgi:hypothetical protein
MTYAKSNIRTIALALSTVGCLGVGLVLIILSFLFYDAPRSSEFSELTTKGTAPVINIRSSLYRDSVTSVSLRYEDAPNAMVDLSAFAGFTPKWTAEETLLHVGPPDRIYVPQSSALETHAYSRPGGEIRLIKAPGEAGDTVWLLEWHPNVGDPEKLILDSELLRQVAGSIPPNTIIIVRFYNEPTKLSFSIRMSKEKIYDVNLWSRGTPAPSAENTRHDHPNETIPR